MLLKTKVHVFHNGEYIGPYSVKLMFAESKKTVKSITYLVVTSDDGKQEWKWPLTALLALDKYCLNKPSDILSLELDKDLKAFGMRDVYNEIINDVLPLIITLEEY